MESQKLPILYNIIAGLAGALGQWAYKKGGVRLTEVPLWSNYMLFVGVLLFCGVMLLFVLGYKAGGKISVVYPFYATTFVWGALIGMVFEKEPFRWNILIGTIIIFIGLWTISRGIQA